jgi:hypothetical protein
MKILACGFCSTCKKQGGGHQKVGEDCPGLEAVEELQEQWEEEAMTAQ